MDHRLAPLSGASSAVDHLGLTEVATRLHEDVEVQSFMYMNVVEQKEPSLSGGGSRQPQGSLSAGGVSQEKSRLPSPRDSCVNEVAAAARAP
jgi:hypothetical protein